MARKQKKTSFDQGWIEVKGARTHNLQDIDVEIPRVKFVVISGVSGSGKSSLAFDTLYAEGQRRYVESLSSYARQFLGQMKKPDCDSIEGLSPAISIDQKQGSHNPRSTVATVTEIMGQIGPRRGQDGLKRAIKSFKDPKICFCKNLKKPSVFQGFWGPGTSRESLRKPKKATKRHPKSSKTQQKKKPKMDHKIINFWMHFGAILGGILGSKLV